jgi:hypothetical protein
MSNATKLGMCTARDNTRNCVEYTMRTLAGLADVPRETLNDMTARDFARAIARKQAACARQTVRQGAP